MLGEPAQAHRVNILFRADLSRWIGDRQINFCNITNPEAAGLLFFNGGERWRFTVLYHPDRGQRPEDFTPARCLQLVRAAVGVPDLHVELGEISPWADSSLLAEKFDDGRVFLAGDSVHVIPPQGGFAVNAGIADAHNLAWKLAAVLEGWAPAALLASYGAERAPVARLTIEHSAKNLAALSSSESAIPGDPAPSRARARPPTTPPERKPEHGLVFGTSYDSQVIVPDGTPPVQVTNAITDYVPNARPGSRAPHVWLKQHGRQVSTLDLFGPGFVLLTGSAGQDWCAAAGQVARRGIPLKAYSIGAGADYVPNDGVWKAVHGIDEDGAVLVRPDGHVAWRSRTRAADAPGELGRAIGIATGDSA